MSWMKKNYHVVTLGGGVLVLAGLGYLGYSSNQSVQETLTKPTARPAETVTSEGEDLAKKVTRMVTQPDPVTQEKTSEERPVNLFTSVSLYIRPGQPNELIDPLNEEPIHPPIPNQWWVDNRLDLTYSDSPYRDPDGDGFTNLEEFKAGTDPNDPSSVGDLVTKLAVAEVESDQWLLKFIAGAVDRGGAFSLSYRKHGSPRPQSNKISPASLVDPGTLFFPGEPGKERFKLVEIYDHPEEKTSTGQPLTYAKVEDQHPTKPGKTYDLPENPRSPGMLAPGRSADHTVVFQLKAVGEEDNLFKVAENGTFSLPAGGSDEKYKLIDVEVDENYQAVSVTVEFTRDGQKETISIPVPVPSP